MLGHNRNLTDPNSWQGILEKWKQQAYTLEKSALDDSSAYISYTKHCCADDLI